MSLRREGENFKMRTNRQEASCGAVFLEVMRDASSWLVGNTVPALEHVVEIAHRNSNDTQHFCIAVSENL